MNRHRMILGVAALLLASACSEQRTLSDTQRATLRCEVSAEGTSALARYSFSPDGLTPTARGDSAAVDLCYYFDADDCSRGALLGHDDRPGYLFPVGHKSWDELIGLEPPASGAESEVAIMPLTRDVEGLAFWVKEADGEYALLRIASVQPATYAELCAGEVATLVLEWRSQEQRGERAE